MRISTTNDPGFPSAAPLPETRTPLPPSTPPSVGAAVQDHWEDHQKDGADAPSLPTVQSRIYIDPHTRQAVVEVRDAQTQQVIRESPPEKVRQLAENLQKLALAQLDAHA